MSFINHTRKEVNCKIIYFGPGLSGKTTNIQSIYEATHSEQRGKLVTLSTENERTLFFDFLPLGAGQVRGYQVRFHLYSIPGQTFYEISRDFILKGVDGIVFVADSQPERFDANLEALRLLQASLERQGYGANKIPLIFQYNKRDAREAVPVAELEAALNPQRRPHLEAVAVRGEGVMETLQMVCQAVLRELQGEKPQGGATYESHNTGTYK